MGREIIVQAIKVGLDKPLFEDYICGRDSATNYLASWFYSAAEDKEDFDWELTFDIMSEDLKTIIYELRTYADKDELELNRVELMYEDLREARRHAVNGATFTEFTGMMKEAADWMDEFNSTANHLVDYIERAIHSIQQHYLNENGYINYKESLPGYFVKIILSE